MSSVHYIADSLDVSGDLVIYRLYTFITSKCMTAWEGYALTTTVASA